jgi:hypothetical protein
MVSVIIPMIRKISSILIILSICISVNAQVSDENTILEIEEKTDQEGNGNNKKVKKVIIPTLSYNNSIKTSFGVMAGMFYHTKIKDTISPESISMFIASYSTNKTWFAIIPNKFYLKEDKYRSIFVAGVGNINFQTYLDWGNIFNNLPINPPPIFEEEGTFIDYSTKFEFVYTNFTVNIYDRLYLGLNFMYAHTNTTFDINENLSDSQDLFGFGLSSEYDKRDSQMLPINGFNSKLFTNTFLESLGSTTNYTNITFEYNNYFKQGELNTLLLRAYAQAAFGDVPFAGQNVVGMDDLRGYSNGKFRANQVYDLQSEYRHWLSDKWGYVAFGGMATAIDKASELSFEKLLPAVGVGVRFMAIPSSKISVGIDVAAGKDDWGVYFRIGEAFGR